MRNSNLQLEVTSESGSEYVVFGEWEHPKFHITRIQLRNTDVTEDLRDTKVWETVSNLAVEEAMRIALEGEEYLRDIIRES